MNLTTEDHDTSPQGDLTVARLMRAIGVASIIAAFAVSPRFDSVDIRIAVATLPAGVYLIRRLHPKWEPAMASAALLLPVGFFWLVSETVAVFGERRLEPDLQMMAAAFVLLVVGIGAASMSRTSPVREDQTLDLIVAHYFTRIFGVFLIALAVVVPVLADAHPDAGIVPAPISLGSLAAGAFLATRPFPRDAIATALVTLLAPVASVWFMFGWLAGVRGDDIEPEMITMAAAAALLVVAFLAALRTWGSRQIRTTEVAAKTLAVAVWITVVMGSVQAIAEEPEFNYVTPIAMELDGSDLFISVPFQGGCGTSHLTVSTELHGTVLEVAITEPIHTFHCLAGCLAGENTYCTDVLEHRVDPAPPAGVSLVVVHGPATGLLRLPIALTIGGTALGGAIWMAGQRWFGLAGRHRVQR